jgi:hypothetical protein
MMLTKLTKPQDLKSATPGEVMALMPRAPYWSLDTSKLIAVEINSWVEP